MNIPVQYFLYVKEKNGKKFFSGSHGEIKIWSSEDFSLINTLYGHKGYIYHMAIIQKKIAPLKIIYIKITFVLLYMIIILKYGIMIL